MGLLDTGTAGTVLEWVFSQGGGAFSFFFILSGFVLTWSLRPTDTAARFWQRRVARIYPNHAAIWLAALGMGCTAAWSGQPGACWCRASAHAPRRCTATAPWRP